MASEGSVHGTASARPARRNAPTDGRSTAYLRFMGAHARTAVQRYDAALRTPPRMARTAYHA